MISEISVDEKEKEIILRVRQMLPYSKIIVEKKGGEIYRYVIEESHLFQTKKSNYGII